MNRSAKIAGLAILLAATAAGAAQAAWPKDRPIQFLVAFAPGGSSDVMVRAMEPYLEKELGANIVVENKPGASGEIAYTALSKAKPDGYTFGLINTPGYLSMQVQRKLGYDPHSIRPIARLVDDPTTLTVRADAPFKSIKDLVDAAKTKPGALSMGSSGVGTDDHLALILLSSLTGVRIVHVPFAGASETRTAVLGGHITVGGINVSEVAGNDQSKLRVLGQLGHERITPLTDVPTAREQGFDVVMSSERGIAAQRGLPDEIVGRFSEAVRAVLANPEFQAKARDLALPIAYLPGDEWEKRMLGLRASFQDIWNRTPWAQ